MPLPNIDWCARAIMFRDAYDSLVMGKSKARVRFGDDEVQYSRADISRLEQLMREAERNCALASGQLDSNGNLITGGVRVRRHAIRAGFKGY